jgi:hypothetical protein
MYHKLLTYLLEGGGLALAARGAWFAWMQWAAYRDSRAARAAVHGRKDIADALGELRYNTPASYAHIIRVHNGGGDLKAGLPMYMTCVSEVCDTDRPPLRGTISGIEIDDQYREMVAELLRVKDGSTEVKSVDNVLLKDIFSMMQARYARSILLKVNRDGIYFLRTTSSTDPLNSPESNIHFRKAISVLRKLY